MSLTVRHLSVALSGKTILHDLDVEFPAGKRTAIIGPNGAVSRLESSIQGRSAF